MTMNNQFNNRSYNNSIIQNIPSILQAVLSYPSFAINSVVVRHSSSIWLTNGAFVVLWKYNYWVEINLILNTPCLICNASLYINVLWYIGNVKVCVKGNPKRTTICCDAFTFVYFLTPPQPFLSLFSCSSFTSRFLLFVKSRVNTAMSAAVLCLCLWRH